MQERNQFRVLYRGFLTRIIDLDVLSQHGDVSNAIARFASVLAAFSFMFMLGIVPRYMTTAQPRSLLIYPLWNDEEFLLSATIAVAGLLAVLAWNSFLPERRDCLILGSLPIPLRTFALAKTAAVATALAIAVTAINVFTGPAFPLAIAGRLRYLPAAVFGWWITSAAAALFVFSAVIALQGIASQLLPWRAFLRISGLLQMAGLALVLFWFFASPPFALTVLHTPARGAFLPSYWFTGLLHVFIGGRTPALDQLAWIAIRNLGVAALIAVVTTVSAWRRNPRRIVEAPEITPSKRRLLLPGLARLLCPRPIDRTIFLFTARTLARSRQHRLLLAVYGGAGLALAMTFLSTFFSGDARTRWDRPNMPFLAAGWLLLFAAVMGTRALFVLPQDASANWAFRITQVRSAHLYFASVRRALLLTAALPVWIAASCFYVSVWHGDAAAGALLLLMLAGMIFVYGALRDFRKVPFTCSWFPQSAQSRMKVMVWAPILTIFATLISAVQLWGLSSLARFVVLGGILSAIAVYVRARTLEASMGGLEFEGISSTLDMQTLDFAGESYAHEDDTPVARGWVRPWHFAVALIVAGFVYERAGQSRDRALYPEVGHAYDIGGRKLNLSCAGEGAPVVVFEANPAQTGYMWAPIQRQVARFTRACWYDRAGYGWSDPGPFPRHSDQIARDLHALLQTANVAPPYVLVGSDMSAFHVRVFRGYYPRETAGLVLIDPMNEDMTINIHNHIELFRPFVIRFFETLGAVGLWRLFSDEPQSASPGYALQEFRAIAALNAQAKSIATQPKEKPMWVNGELARQSGNFGETPLIVLSADQRGPVADEKLEDHELTMRLNERLATHSRHGIWRVVHAHQNRIRLEAPEAIIESIRQVWAANSPVAQALLP
jgi:hypothetical protein